MDSEFIDTPLLTCTRCTFNTYDDAKMRAHILDKTATRCESTSYYDSSLTKGN